MDPLIVIVIIAAMATLLGVITTLVIAVRIKNQTTIIQKDVNSNLTAMTERVEQLTQLLSTTNINVPPTDYENSAS